MAKQRFGQATRDFIPANENPTPLEVERGKQLRALGAGRVRLDFVPGPDYVKAPPSGHKAQAHEALERAMARQASAAREEFQAAVARLRDMNVAQATEFITQAPTAIQEMYLVAEGLHGARKSILDRFPPQDPEAVKRWEEINSGAPDEASKGTAEALPTDAKE